MPARILIIEDNPANLDLMTYLLTAFGHAPLSAGSAEQGLVVAHQERPDLIICDIQLPGLDGHAVARQLKAEPAFDATPLVAVTAFAMVGDREKVMASGFDGYISKPIDPEAFVSQVEVFLRPDLRTGRITPAGTPPAAGRAQSKRTTILAVDDQPVNLNLKGSVLEPLGYGVLTANGITQGLQLARETPPDLIVSDLNMSDGSGYEFIQAVKADPRLKDVPFVFLTSTYCDEVSRVNGLALGADRFLFRPIEPQTLLAEIEACLAERRTPK